MHRSSHTPTRSINCLTKNAAMQTDRVRPVSCGSIAQDGLISYNSESSLPTKPPTPARPTPPSYSTYSRRMMSKTRPNTPRYQSSTASYNSSCNINNNTNYTNTSNSAPRSPSGSRYTTRILDSPHMLANRTNNQYPTTPVKNGHYYNDSAAGGNAVYGRSNGGRSMSIPGLSFNGDANLSVINTTLMNNGDNKDCGSSAVSRDGRSPTKRVESPISAGCGRHTARRAESPRHSTCKS